MKPIEPTRMNNFRKQMENKKAEYSIEKSNNNQLHSEINNRKEQADYLESQKSVGSDRIASGVQEVKPLTARFADRKELVDYKNKAWEQLEDTAAGEKLMSSEGGRESVISSMSGGVRHMLTKMANKCERIKDIPPTEEGNVVHKLGELYYLEKRPEAILSGKKMVEQKLSYTDEQGKENHRRLDSVAINKDGSVVISDYKRVDISVFERTSDGSQWARWARENFGPNFREMIADGSDPLFSEHIKVVPSEIRQGFTRFMDKVRGMHQKQLESYKTLYAESTGTPLDKISVAIVPYYVTPN